ncbi:fungal specific transcription factor domain-containing protein [Aspergillus clavatus NRRL 1]|uniref:Fungal specific transcription factor domain protein n=1 Tax=Aspergillus clavatus (strain ATCC 1007 / CBS 513.65 / DSM 816 / NCTC 3887 / NRRL 1 / QM 1276 / 107) TaxID=344612 RepID=A1CEJ3_ASPCL|nr:fungal specific transcription factor domain protein [Aspergillus clavatus NRRL 1]EAW11292.1 fungal specific transcription factor domain protein [Aspergillus clavatus NRRL 1]
MRLHSHGNNYVGSVHWAPVLDSISELRDHYEEEEEARMLATNDHMRHHVGGPRLLYEPVLATKADLVASIPARPVVDRMVARYFNARGVVPEIVHSGRFLQEYERFWLEPAAASYIWIGLLCSVMCLSTQYQQWIGDSADPETPVRVQLFQEQTVHCLVLGQYTRGVDYVLETIINYLVSETFLSQDDDIGIWLVHGMLVQLALSRGYHRDPRNFSKTSIFAGEMRRRVWAVIVQIDLRLSGQMALPRLLKLQQYDTAEPRNLLDTDFNEDTVELPPSRPETEITPVLYSLAKNRIDKMNGPVNDTQEHPYTEIMELHHKLEKLGDSLPPVFKWQPLSQSFMVQPQIVMHRVLLQLSIQRTVIWLHRKYLAPSYTQAHYASSRSACIQAAIKILELQQIVEEETQRDGLLYPVRWMFMSSRLRAVFLLGISILCYYVQLVKSSPDVSLDQDTGTLIHTLLCDTYPLWLRLSTVPRDVQRVVEHLRALLGLTGGQEGVARLASFPTVVSSLFMTPQDAAESLDQFRNQIYEGNRMK